jgi:hypothetical protein
MAKKTTTPRAKRTSKSNPAAENTTAKKSTAHHHEAQRDRVPEDHDIERDEAERESERGAPVEHYHVEPTRGETTGSAGSVEQETLDRDAPYNRTYGR